VDWQEGIGFDLPSAVRGGTLTLPTPPIGHATP
jgi:hypothetical protein